MRVTLHIEELLNELERRPLSARVFGLKITVSHDGYPLGFVLIKWTDCNDL
jgi:hypothetical protein